MKIKKGCVRTEVVQTFISNYYAGQLKPGTGQIACLLYCLVSRSMLKS